MSKSYPEIESNRNRNRFWHVILHSYLCNALCKFLIKIESTCRLEIKKQTPQLTLLYCGRTVRSSHMRCSIKKLFLKISQYSQETPAMESLYKKVADLKTRPWDYLFWKTSAYGCFFTVPMVHCYMSLKVQGLDGMAASDFRVRVISLVFYF